MTNHVEKWFQFRAITGFTDSLGKYLHGGELGGIRREETKIPETRKPREARLFEQPSLPRGAPLLFHRVRRELLRGPINPALITSHFCWSLTRNRLGSRNGQSLSKSFSLSANNRQPVLRAPLAPFASSIFFRFGPFVYPRRCITVWRSIERIVHARRCVSLITGTGVRSCVSVGQSTLMERGDARDAWISPRGLVRIDRTDEWSR